MLIVSERHSEEDLAAWKTAEREDAANAGRWRGKLPVMMRYAADAAREFAAAGPCYAGVSWGKDSVALAHCLALYGVRVPLVWIRLDGTENPDCLLVRDAFLSMHDMDYHEIVAPLGVHRRTEVGFAQAAARFGARHISGVRSAESRTRALREARWGIATERTCAPLTRWTTAHVFALLHAARLPVHPAYACTIGGLLPRDRLRVAALGGERGAGRGRAEWEQRYYREEMAAIRDTLAGQRSLFAPAPGLRRDDT